MPTSKWRVVALTTRKQLLRQDAIKAAKTAFDFADEGIPCLVCWEGLGYVVAEVSGTHGDVTYQLTDRFKEQQHQLGLHLSTLCARRIFD